MYKETELERYTLLSTVLTAATVDYVTALLESTQKSHHLGDPLMLTRIQRLNADRVRAFEMLDKFVCTHDVNFC